MAKKEGPRKRWVAWCPVCGPTCEPVRGVVPQRLTKGGRVYGWACEACISAWCLRRCADDRLVYVSDVPAAPAAGGGGGE